MVRRAISANTAARMTTMMEAVVEEGTAKAARIKGYTLAAKTGTARKLNANGGGYLMEYMASTAGFFPSRNPAVAMIVVIDAPKRKGYFGGAVAAPVFQRIADATLRHLAIAPERRSAAADRRSRARRRARTSRPSRNDRTATARGDGGTRRRCPISPGFSAREAVRTLIELGWEPRLRGEGIVRRASERRRRARPVGEGGVCLLALSRFPIEPDPVQGGEP